MNDVITNLESKLRSLWNIRLSKEPASHRVFTTENLFIFYDSQFDFDNKYNDTNQK